MKVAAIGNCQFAGLALALNNRYEGADVEYVDMADLRARGLIQATADRLPQFDVVLSQQIDALHLPDYAPFRTHLLEERCRTIFKVPQIVFTGFHPDCTAIVNEKGVLRSPVGEYHSTLVAAGYSLGLPPTRTQALFNTYCYRQLGYFDEFDKAKKLLAERFAAAEYDAEPLFAIWLEQGIFMHTYNHPTLAALEVLAAAVAGKIGLRTRDANPNAADPLAASTIWPMYPELARPIGLAGSLEFKIAGAEQRISLQEFVETSYTIYDARPDAVRNAVGICRVASVLDTILVRRYSI